MGIIQTLQTELKKLWTNELYSKEFNSSPLKHKDFDHALKHVFKAATRLLEMTEEVDHSDEMQHDPAAIRKYLADLVISTVRLANVSPTGEVDIEKAIFDRIERKMGKKIEIVVACKNCGVVMECNHHDSLGRCQCTGEHGPCCQCS